METKHMETKNEKNEIAVAVVVTTEYRGVFFGYADPERIRDEQIELKRARLCLSWSAAMRGFMGLACIGPDEGCRIGPAVERITLRKITSVIECSPEAVKRWEAAPWR